MECQCQHHKCPCLIGPSMLASDLANLGSEARSVLAAGADYIHLDVMDGHFVPNISWGPPVIESLRKSVGEEPFFDCHMMVSNPLQWVKPIKDSGGSQYTFHIETSMENSSTDGPAAICTAIRAAGMKVGVALKPGTPISAIASVVALVDMVLVMTVEPGFGGQKFQPNMMPKVLELRTQHPLLDIEVDGGLGPSTIDAAAKAGANMIVAGSACFKPGVSPAEPILVMRQSVLQHGRGEKLQLEAMTSEPLAENARTDEDAFKLSLRTGDDLKKIDLNADAGEGFDDAGLLKYVTSVNIACGGHAGTPESIARTVALAAKAGACIGAHPSFVDTEGFGRRALDTPPQELRDQVLWQVGALDSLCRAYGSRVSYIKPHGALYHTVLAGGEQAEAVLEAARMLQLPLLLMPKSPWASFGEGFAERAYDGDSLRPRDKPGAVIHDVDEAAKQASEIAMRPNIHSICVHGDSPSAVSVAKAVRAALDKEFQVRPFLPPLISKLP